MNDDLHGPHRNRHYYRAERMPTPTDEIARPEFCPRCSQRLQQEPMFAFCRLGCGRMFVVDRKLMHVQRLYEARTR